METPLSKQVAQRAADRDFLKNAVFFHPPRPIVMSVVNQKGGVGKTTSAVNLSVALALEGIRVVVIDADPQGNASTALGIPHAEGINSTYEVVSGTHSLSEVLQPCAYLPELMVSPSTIDLSGAEIELVDKKDRAQRLSLAIDTFLSENPDVEVILIDCPPSLGLVTLNALVAADEIFVPIQTEYYALEGLSQLWSTIDRVRSQLNPRLHVGSILLTMSDRRTKLAEEVENEVRTHFPDLTFDTVIPRSVRISEAPSYGQSVLFYDPTGSGSLAYRKAAFELCQHFAHEYKE